MLKRLAFLLFLAVSPLLAQQAAVTGTLAPYANGSVTEQASGNAVTINGQGFFQIPITSTPNHTFRLASAGSTFGPFSVTVVVSPNGITDISQQLLAAMPIPNPFIVAALTVQSAGLNVAGLNYHWPIAHAAGCLVDDGTGNLSWSTSCGAGGGIVTIGVHPANGVSGTSSGGNNPLLTIVLGDIQPSSVTVSNTAVATQWDFIPTTHATATKAGAASIGSDTVVTPGVYLLPQAPASGFYYGTKSAGKVTHTYVNGITATCNTNIVVVNGLITGCS